MKMDTNTVNKIIGAVQAVKESYGDVPLYDLPKRAVDDLTGYLATAFALAGFGDEFPRSLINRFHWWNLTLTELASELTDTTPDK